VAVRVSRRPAAVRYLFPVLLIMLAACSTPAPPNDRDVTAVLEAFYGAMKTGDTAAAMKLIAPDAQFVESGRLETRDEYEKNHLPADIQFESQVTGVRGPMRVTFQGDTAWVIATTEYEGTFDGRPVNFVSGQLAVLTRETGDWLIRSIHWSSRPR
jgi:ketosteroid isomerase-like protein